MEPSCIVRLILIVFFLDASINLKNLFFYKKKNFFLEKAELYLGPSPEYSVLFIPLACFITPGAEENRPFSTLAGNNIVHHQSNAPRLKVMYLNGFPTHSVSGGYCL